MLRNMQDHMRRTSTAMGFIEHRSSLQTLHSFRFNFPAGPCLSIRFIIGHELYMRCTRRQVAYKLHSYMRIYFQLSNIDLGIKQNYVLYDGKQSMI